MKYVLSRTNPSWTGAEIIGVIHLKDLAQTLTEHRDGEEAFEYEHSLLRKNGEVELDGSTYYLSQLPPAVPTKAYVLIGGTQFGDQTDVLHVWGYKPTAEELSAHVPEGLEKLVAAGQKATDTEAFTYHTEEVSYTPHH